jgi:hypothetical protein
MDRHKNSIKFTQQKDVLKLVIQNVYQKPEQVLEYLIKFSREVIGLFRDIKETERSEKSQAVT